MTPSEHTFRIQAVLQPGKPRPDWTRHFLLALEFPSPQAVQRLFFKLKEEQVKGSIFPFSPAAFAKRVHSLRHWSGRHAEDILEKDNV